MSGGTDIELLIFQILSKISENPTSIITIISKKTEHINTRIV